MKRSRGRLIGLTIALLVMLTGMLVALYMCDVVADPAAHSMNEWLLLSGFVLSFGLGTFALIVWIDTDATHREGSWLS